MKVSDIAKITSSRIICGRENSVDFEFVNAVAADLMSEIMLETAEKSIMITGLINPQVIRTAEMMDIFVIIFVRGKEVKSEMIDLAEDRGIVIMSTDLSMFETCGRLYDAGLKSGH